MVLVPEELEILVLVLAKGLCNLGLFDDVEYGLGFLLELLVGRNGPFTLLGKFWEG